MTKQDFDARNEASRRRVHKYMIATIAITTMLIVAAFYGLVVLIQNL